MKRADYYNFIEEKLHTLALRINSRGHLNILDYHVHAENFYRDFFNLLYDSNFINLNAIQQNSAAIDLVDIDHKRLMQISSTNTKAKLDNALSKSILRDAQYYDYTFCFLSIACDAAALRKKSYSPPSTLLFDPTKDIFDVQRILNNVNNLDIDKLESVYNLVKKELFSADDLKNIESNLSKIIQLISQVNLDPDTSDLNKVSFHIQDKIDFNDLEISQDIINDFKIHCLKVDKIFTTFDIEGTNRSLSVLNSLHRIYNKGRIEELKGDRLFMFICKELDREVQQSYLSRVIPKEEISQSIEVLVVDAFIRCKIFKNPNNYNYVTSR